MIFSLQITYSQCPVDACDFALKTKQMHEEEEEEDDEKPYSDHFKVTKGRVIGPALLTVHTEESYEESNLQNKQTCGFVCMSFVIQYSSKLMLPLFI